MIHQFKQNWMQYLIKCLKIYVNISTRPILSQPITNILSQQYLHYRAKKQHDPVYETYISRTWQLKHQHFLSFPGLLHLLPLSRNTWYLPELCHSLLLDQDYENRRQQLLPRLDLATTPERCNEWIKHYG